MKQITFTLFLVLSGAFLLQSTGQSHDPILFPKNIFTIETKTVKTSAGEKKVTYHSYLHIPYVAKPVNKDYQSLNVSVPVKVDDVGVDISNAPILFVIGVGGYMSVNNARTGITEGGSSRGTDTNTGISSRADLALAAGFVVVSPGCRGRDNKTPDGTYYGKAPAAIVDLKAAVKYLRHNKGIIPGNTDRIISVGCSAGGALSALLGASGNSSLYDNYLKEIGAAAESDDIFATACYSPITDLEHADMAYEWMYGNVPTRSGLVNRELSEQLKTDFTEYQKSLNLKGRNQFGILTSENYDDYLLQYFLIPSATEYLETLTTDQRNEYLKNNPWIKWDGNKAAFGFTYYCQHVGRMKGLPAFDDFAKKQPEPILFGNESIDARHFTNFSLRYSTGNKNAEVGEEITTLTNLMNAMYFTSKKPSGCAGYWWIRNGSRDNHTSQTVAVNLVTSLEYSGKNVNAALFWDGGHCADDDPEGFINWIGNITGLKKHNNADK